MKAAFEIAMMMRVPAGLLRGTLPSSSTRAGEDAARARRAAAACARADAREKVKGRRPCGCQRGRAEQTNDGTRLSLRGFAVKAELASATRQRISSHPHETFQRLTDGLLAIPGF